MDTWLNKAARQQDSAGGCAVHVCVNSDEKVVAFFTLTSFEVRGETVKSASSGMKAVPSTLLGRLALDHNLRGQQIGALLMMEALHLAHQSAKFVASRLVILDAKNDKLVERYRELGFKPTVTDPHRMYMKMSTARASLKAAGYKV